MIGWLSGSIIDKQQPGKLIIDVNGVGYEVETSLSTFFQLELEEGLVSIYIHTVVREDAFLLYGFIDKQERALFRSLIKVNGVGPKLAISILSSTTPDEFVQCIYQKNTQLLTKLPGIGKKTAERLVVEMKDSIAQLPLTTNKSHHSIEVFNQQDEAICALEALGYKRQEATKAVQRLDNGNLSCEQLIRKALQSLAIKQGA